MEKLDKNLPKLRFKEFSGEWENKPLKNVACINKPTKNLPQTFIYIDLEAVSKGILLFKKHINLDNAPSRAQRLLKRKDFIFQTVRPYQKNNYYFDLEDNYHYVASTGYAKITAYESSKYLYHYIHTDDFVNRVIEKCTGSNYPAINSKDLANLLIYIPTLPEQQKIADCLSSLDELINLQEQKLENLKKHKQGLMQQLFPDLRGGVAPSLRFMGFTEDWRVVKLKQISSYTKGFAFKAKDYCESGIRIIRVSDLGESSVLEQNEKIYISNDLTLDYSKYEIKVGDIIITTVGSKAELEKSAVGRCIYILKENTGLLNQNLLKIDSFSQDINSFFLFINLTSSNYRNYISSIQRGNANQANIAVKDLFNFSISIPTLAEQQKIADCLSSLDELITANNDKIIALKQHKKGMMQGLFPKVA